MKWKCNKCGHEQPAHPLTKPEDMPECHQFSLNPKIKYQFNPFTYKDERIDNNKCGGTFEKIIN